MFDVHNLITQYMARLESDLSVVVNAIEVDHEGNTAHIAVILSDGHTLTLSGAWPHAWAPSIRSAIISSTTDSFHKAREAVLSGITSMANEDRPQ